MAETIKHKHQLVIWNKSGFLTKIPFKKSLPYLKSLYNRAQACPDLSTIPKTNKILLGLVRSCQDCQDVKILKECIIIHYFISSSNARLILAVINLQSPKSMSSKFHLDDTRISKIITVVLTVCHEM